MTQLILGQLLNGIIVGSLYGIIALGVTLTFGLTGIVNFALGAFMMLGAYMVSLRRQSSSIPDCGNRRSRHRQCRWLCLGSDALPFYAR